MIEQTRGTPSPGEQVLTLAVSEPSLRVRLVQVVGELDLLTKPRLTACVDEVLRMDPRHLILDLNGVRYLASSGLQVLVHAKDRCAEHGAALHVTGATHHAVARPIGIMRLDQVLTMHPTWMDALSAITAVPHIGRGSPDHRQDQHAAMRSSPVRPLSRPAPA